MKIDDLLNQSGEWLKGTGLDSDIVISSRVRLARNLSRFPFLTVATPSIRVEIEEFIKDRLKDKKIDKDISYFSVDKLNQIDRHLLMERHLISRELADDGKNAKGIAFSQDETISIMVNEEDHLRMQVLRSGLQFESAWKEIDRIDSILEGSLNYAFSSQFGYLTCCPTNVGTGMRISIMVHLPALVFVKQMDKVLQSLSRINYSVRGLFGEGTPGIGDYYQISNQITLGKSEGDIVQEMKNVIPQIIQFERTWRYKLLEDDRKRVEDRVWRAYGILRNARSISTEETMDLLSAVRLGLNLKILNTITVDVINELFIFTQPSHLQRIKGRPLEPAERDAIRADFLREKLK